MIGNVLPNAEVALCPRLFLNRLKGSNMKHLFLALPAIVLVAAAAAAQTETTTGVATGADAAVGSGETFGTNWSLSVGTTFFTDGENRTLRSAEDITTGWQSLPQEDRDMIMADCQAFLAAHGEAATEGSTEATGTADTAAPDTGAAATAETDSALAMTAGYDIAEMQSICDAVEQF
jgi:hypothetical protein